MVSGSPRSAWIMKFEMTRPSLACSRGRGVEDTDQVRIYAVIAVIGHDRGLGEALGLVVDRRGPMGLTLPQ